MSETPNTPYPTTQMGADLIRDILKERRRERRWRNIRFFFGFIVVLLVMLMLFSGEGKSPSVEGMGHGPYVSLVRLNGLIAPEAPVSAENIIPELEKAFRDKQSRGVIIDINSGGGTPVQAAIIHDSILRLKAKFRKKVIIVGEDMMASGAYFIAVSGDKIYANPNTITGSIGVVMEGFGFPDLIKKIGVDRRVITSGIHKDRLDPFMPQLPEDKAKIDSVLQEVHDNFNQAVLAGRKGKLHGDLNELFSGDFWTGQTALRLGLIDELGNLHDAMQKEFHVVRYKDYTGSGNLLRSVFSQLGSVLNFNFAESQSRLIEKA